MEITLENLYVYINWGLEGKGRFPSYRMGERDPHNLKIWIRFHYFSVPLASLFSKQIVGNG